MRGSLLPLAAFFAAGILIEDRIELTPLVCASCAGLWFLWLIVAARGPRLRGTLEAACACATGALALALRLHAPVPVAGPGPIVVTLLGAPELRDGRCAISGFLHAAVPGRARLFAEGPSCDLLPGQRAVARLETLAPFAEPGNPGARAVGRSFVRRGVHRQAAVREGILYGSAIGTTSLQARIERLRRRVSQALDPDARPTPGGALLRALVTADRSRLDETTLRAFRASGTAHLLAVSGLHVGFVFGLAGAGARGMLWILPSVRVQRRRRGIALSAAALAALAYAALAGANPPVLRAAAMGAAGALAWMGGRPRAPLQALCIAALIILSFDPAALFEASFVLSFTAVAGLLAWAPGASGVAGILHATLATSLSAGPLLAVYGLPLPATGLAANLIAVPWVSALLVPLGLLVGLLGAAWDAAPAAPGELARALAELAMCTVAALEGPDLLAKTSRPQAWAALAAGLAFGLRLRALGKRRASFGLLALAGVAGLIGLQPRSHGSDPPSVWIFDVGQGDAVLIDAGDAEALVDAGPRFGGFDAGRDRVAPALRALSVRSLRALALTHSDLDHLGGAPALLDALPIEELWITRATWRHPAARIVRERAARRAIPLRVLGRGDRLALGDTELRVLWPPRDGLERAPNAGSLVMELRHGARCVLLPADIPAEVERELAGQVEPCEALKLAHHGSRSSSDPSWLRALAPEVAVTSAGTRRRAPLPHPEVSARLRAGRVAHFVTGRDGAVRLWLGRDTLAVHPFRTAPRARACP
jgi:competence protein ComEC